MSIQELIWDEIEAIEGYTEYLKKHPEDIDVIKQIMNDEEKHIVMLNKLKEK